MLPESRGAANLICSPPDSDSLDGNLMRRMIARSVPITRTGSSSVERELEVQGASESSSLAVSWSAGHTALITWPSGRRLGNF